ncbi:MAG: sensor histidine kinase [Pirellulales bacterium]|nr:sensor histidine kinase [Pirellulales bacterium]
MDDGEPYILPLERRHELESVLEAWHGATVRLEQTHEMLCAEVRRLTTELEAKNRELARKNRLADLGQVASLVAHEVRNGLMPVTLYLSLLKRRLSDDPGAVTIVEKIAGACTSLDATVNDLLHFAGQREPRRQRCPVRKLVEDVLGGLAAQLRSQGIETTVDVPFAQTAWADPDMLRRVVLNLTLNAIDAMPDGGELVITSFEGRDWFELEVADSGPGMHDDVRRRACEPFFTTKSAGTGLGLAIVNHIADTHGGAIRIDNCPEGGAALTLRLPRAMRQEAAA